MSLRDDTEAVLRSWDAHETDRGFKAVIDYDCCPPPAPAKAAASRLDVYRSLRLLWDAASGAGDSLLAHEIEAHLAYLRELMGQRTPLGDYVRATQGCLAAGWPDEYVTARGDLARAHLEALGIGWGPATEKDLEQAENVIDVAEAAQAIREAAAKAEPAVRSATGAEAAYELSVQVVREDAYWSYWLDGAGKRIRLRINTHRARFTRVRVRQFALHEVLAMRCSAPVPLRWCPGCVSCQSTRPRRSQAKDLRKHSPCSSLQRTRP